MTKREMEELLKNENYVETAYEVEDAEGLLFTSRKDAEQYVWDTIECEMALYYLKKLYPTPEELFHALHEDVQYELKLQVLKNDYSYDDVITEKKILRYKEYEYFKEYHDIK